MNEYIIKDNKKLRCGFTTGTCATAASTAATKMLLTSILVEKIPIILPIKDIVEIPILDTKINKNMSSCCVKKDSGDDPDVTNGMLIYSTVSFNHTNKINIDGGIGIGRVTQKGLDCEVGKAAINSVPLSMIEKNVMDICSQYGYDGGLDILIEAPEGERIAKKTFNPHLGIIGGISIIGTTGIVEPMSEKALVDSLKIEMNVIKEKGYKNLLAFPGNYAQNFIDKNLNIRGENSIKFSNYLGEILNFSVEMGFEEVLIVGHIGKMVKVAGGMMNTHSNNGDFRMEVISCYAALNGANKEVIKELLSCVTTDHAIEILMRENINKQVIKNISDRAKFYIDKKVDNNLKTKIIIYSNIYGILN